MKQLILALAATALLASCSGRNARALYDDARAAEDTGNIVLALEKYDELVRDHPGEALAETSLYRAVMIRSNSPGDKAPAVVSQALFLERHPESPEAPKVMFMMAFLYNNELMKTDSARKYYERFLSLYPGHELAPSARFELETLGQGPEEILGGGDDGAGS